MQIYDKENYIKNIEFKLVYLLLKKMKECIIQFRYEERF